MPETPSSLAGPVAWSGKALVHASAHTAAPVAAHQRQHLGCVAGTKMEGSSLVIPWLQMNAALVR